MTYQGHIRNGVVVLDEENVLEEGAAVRVVPVEQPAARETVGQRLLKYAGKAKGLPPDAGLNHDHYLYGTPKK